MNADTAASNLVFEISQHSINTPAITIAIPTFNRADLVIESIQSAAQQVGFDDYEILIIDNASEFDSVSKVKSFLEVYQGPSLRYFVNDHNLGMFGNWNRCLDLARGEWVTILSDDDLLRPTFLSQILSALKQHPNAKAIIARTTILDQRADIGRRHRMITRIKGAASAGLRYHGNSFIRLTPRRLFWGNIAGSSLACLFHKGTALEYGGFDPKQFPSADYALHLQFSEKSQHIQINEVLGNVRIQLNETIKPETLHGFIVANHRHRTRLIAEGAVPSSWKRWLAPLIGYEVDATRRLWGVDIDVNRLARDTKMPYRRGTPRITWLVKALHGGV